MRIALVSEAIPPQTNGVVTTLGRLAAHLAGRGHELLLIGPRYRENAGRPGLVDVPAVPLPFYPEMRVALPFWRRAFAALDRFAPDLVHVATPATLGWAAVRHARRRGYPVVSSYHTNLTAYSLYYHLGAVVPIAWRYLRWFHNATRRTYCPTPAVQAELAARGIERTELWPRGVDPDRFSPAHRSPALRARYGFAADDPVLLYVGRLAREKELDRLFRAYAALRPRFPGLRLLLVGDGPDRPRLARTYGGEGVVFAGRQTGEALAAHYASADVFAFPSPTETFGNVVQEALASGLPVVAVAAGGVRDVVRAEETGLLADPRDPEAFGRQLARLLGDRALRARLAAAGR
ncbi:MAG TPA: glycosyltransferase family 1 protein, partial [Thermodesulfobacteriota bacterium]|nr:glycosyltransferase family 1 protein [Thermodesulfobacteriota bacterium]